MTESDGIWRRPVCETQLRYTQRFLVRFDGRVESFAIDVQHVGLVFQRRQLVVHFLLPEPLVVQTLL